MTSEIGPHDEYEWLFDARVQPVPRPEPPAALTDTIPRPLSIGTWRNETQPKSHALLRLGIVTCLAAAAVIGIMDRTGDTSVQSPEPAAPHLTQAACIARLPLAEKLGQKLMLGATASTLQADAAPFARQYIGGVVLMDEVPAATTRTFVAAQPLPPLVATDQEGGTVQRYKSEGALPSPHDMVGQAVPDEAERIIRKDDTYLRSQGVNMNLAPLADVAAPGGPTVLGSRVFSDDPKTVTLYAAAYVHAGLEAGVLPTLKHFPGLGSANGNTDNGPAEAPASQRDLAPYVAMAGTSAAVMVGNQTVAGLTDGLPASLSRAAITTLLRSQLGYGSNVVVTDSLSAGAVTQRFSEADAVVRAWEAGADEALVVALPTGQSSGQFVADVLARAQAAVNDGSLSVTEVNSSVQRLFALNQKSVDACSLAPNK